MVKMNEKEKSFRKRVAAMTDNDGIVISLNTEELIKRRERGELKYWWEKKK
jgi:hypothetical protein